MSESAVVDLERDTDVEILAKEDSTDEPTSTCHSIYTR
jgi:hypothetical protein